MESTPLLNGLPEADAESLRRATKSRGFAAGEDLLVAGEKSPGLFVIHTGTAAALVADASGKQREVSVLGAGDPAGEMSLITGAPCTATVRAMTDCDAWFIPRKEFVAVLERSPWLWRNLGMVLSERLTRTTRELASRAASNMTTIVSDGPPEAIAGLVAEVARQVASRTSGATLVIAPGAQQPTDGIASAPALSSVLHDRALLDDHARTADGVARVATTNANNDAAPGADETRAALDLVCPLYEEVVVVADEASAAGLGYGERSRMVLAIVTRPDGEGLPGWVQRLAASTPASVEAAVITGEPVELGVISPTASATIEALDAALPTVALRLFMKESDLPRPGEEPSAAARTAAGQIARRITNSEIGVALGAGAAKGFAHIGVLKVLKESGIPVDCLAGCSIGAVAGALYCGGLSFERIRGIMDGADRKLTKWTLPIASIWSDIGLKNLLRENGPYVRFSQLHTPFAAVACDVRTGKGVTLRKGIVWKAVRASVSVPGMFPAALVGGRPLADGGLVDPVPSLTARAMGADYVIAVDLMSPSARAKQAARIQPAGNGRGRRHTRPNLVEMLWRSMEIMQEEITIRSASHADVTVEPELGRARWKDFSLRSAEFVAAGEEAARAKIDDIRAITGS